MASAHSYMTKLQIAITSLVLQFLSNAKGMFPIDKKGEMEALICAALYLVYAVLFLKYILLPILRYMTVCKSQTMLKTRPSFVRSAVSTFFRDAGYKLTIKSFYYSSTKS